MTDLIHYIWKISGRNKGIFRCYLFGFKNGEAIGHHHELNI